MAEEIVPEPSGSDRAGLLVAEGITLVGGGRQILSGVDLLARSGESLVVTGPSGAGKSSLLLILAGLVAPTAGSVTFSGRAVSIEDDLFRQKRGLVLQNYGLAPALSAIENVTLPLQARGVAARSCVKEALEALAAVGIAALGPRAVGELSGGQRQRVAVARALVGSPELLLADEPTAELDAESRSVVLVALLERARAGATLVIASHDSEVIGSCDVALGLLDGGIEPDPSTGEMGA